MGGGKGGSSGGNSNQMLALQQQQMEQQLSFQQQQVEQMAKMREEQNTKKSVNITEATTAARDAQKEKAAQNSGIKGSIYTDPMGLDSQTTGKKTMLGK